MATLKQTNDNEIKIAIKTENGKSYFYQWDLNQRLIIENVYENTKIHFSQTNDNKCEALSQTPYTENGVMYVDVPNELLQIDGTLNCYVYIDSKSNGYVKEQFSIQVKKREKPEYYDSDLMFSPMVNEILGENIEGGITGKLQYLKDCLDILYQSPPIKLMREVYGENKSLKELLKYISKHESEIYALIKDYKIDYSIDAISSGFSEKENDLYYPDGTLCNILGKYILPSIYPMISISTHKTPYIPISYTVASNFGTLSYGILSLVDLRNINFIDDSFEGLKKSNPVFFSVIANKLFGIYFPKCTDLSNCTIYIDGAQKYIPNGIHLGKYIKNARPYWLFSNIDVDPSTQKETPVYCDKDFYVNGILYLEKLNIPADCIIEFMANAIYVPEGLPTPTLLIGDFNIEKLQSLIQSLMGELSEEDSIKIQDIIGKMASGEFTPEQAIVEIKNIDNRIGIYFEFTEMKGWELQ